MVFEDFEFNPMAAALGLAGAIISQVVLSNSTSGLIVKGLSFVLSFIVCYFMADRMSTK